MEVNIAHNRLDFLITILQNNYLSVSYRKEIIKIVQYGLEQSYLTNTKRATKLINLLQECKRKLDLVEKAKCIMLLEEIKTKTIDQNRREVERRNKVEKEINIMDEHLYRCGMRTKKVLTGGKRIIYVNDLDKFKSKFVEDSEHVVSTSETNIFHYNFKVEEISYMISLKIVEGEYVSHYIDC